TSFTGRGADDLEALLQCQVGVAVILQHQRRTAHHALAGLSFAFGRSFAFSRPPWWVWERYSVHNTRARRRSKFARPYSCRLMVFKRLPCPSTGPLLHGYTRD